LVGEVRRGIERLQRRDPAQAQRLELRLDRLKTMLGPRILPVTAARLRNAGAA
jgi:toxin FitB